MATLADGREEARRVVAEAQGHGVVLRLLGGLAVAVHSPSARHRGLERSYPDLDFVSTERRGFRLEPVFAELGYEANRAFNLYNGDRRLLFYDAAQQRQVDVFLGAFTMCHTIPMADRLTVEPVTLPLAELLLTKLQIVEMNEKDTRDVAALLADHPLEPSDAEAINLPRLEALCGDDWGLWKTVGLSVTKVEQAVATMDLEEQARQTILERLTRLGRALEQAPKTLRWRLRARVGERVKWYDLPEEVRRG